jgi:hypothetical protein
MPPSKAKIKHPTEGLLGEAQSLLDIISGLITKYDNLSSQINEQLVPQRGTEAGERHYTNFIRFRSQANTLEDTMGDELSVLRDLISAKNADV